MFRTELQITQTNWNLSHEDSFLTLGSCFAEVTELELNKFKFKVNSNPFGIIYNPVSIFNILNKELLLDENNFIQKDGVWYNYQLHSSIFANSKDELIRIVGNSLDNIEHSFRQTSVVIITLGTAIVYKLKSNNNTVANCHKSDAKLFQKEFLEVDEIVNAFDNFQDKIRSINKNIRFILSVSPVRHLKDSMPLNQFSKSTLIIACRKIQNQLKNTHYFPSFEIMMDDLRDYRFYKEDMIHPTEQAENYILDKFFQMFFSIGTIALNEKIKNIIRNLNHRPFHTETASYKTFILNTIKQIETLPGFIDFGKEMNHLKQAIKADTK